MDIQIRQATPADAELIASFNLAMALETEGLRLDPARVRAGVAALLNDPAKGYYLLAETAGAVAGQLMITYEWSDWRNGTFWWIQSVYVDPRYRRRGIYRRLYTAVEQMARNNAACGIRLYVEAENTRAQTVYQKLGMKQAHYCFYEVDFVIRRPQQ